MTLTETVDFLLKKVSSLEERLQKIETEKENKPSLNNNKEPIIVVHSDNTVSIFLNDYNDLRSIADKLKDKQIREIKII